MAIRTRDLTREWRRGDAERLARIHNESGRGWPGGAWDPVTPEEMEREARERRLLGLFVAEEGDAFIALCTLYAKPNQTKQSYVPFLTALPGYHGRGYGKAVLLRAVERVYELGVPRVDLDTWRGNLKAVPLYKKSGFMWSPESDPHGVYMQNFTPGARRHPAAAAYFAKHDWYRTLQRDLSLVADEHKRGKVRAYVYHWEEAGSRLHMVYDRYSWGLLEVENDDFRVACFLDDEKLVAGLPHRVRWEIVNHRSDPLEVALVASADPGVKLSRNDFLRVTTTEQVEATFEIAPEIQEKETEPRVPIIRTDLLVNGLPISLEAGFQVQQAVRFAIDHDGMGLRPNRPERVVIQAFNALDRPAEAKLRVSASPGVRLEAGRAAVKLPARGSAEVPLTLTAGEPGPVMLRVASQVMSGKQSVRPKTAELHAHVLTPGDVVGHVEDERVVLESAALQLTISRRGGWTRINDKMRNRGGVAGIGKPQVGPPFDWQDLFDTRAQAWIERGEGRVVAALRTESILRPGIWLERRIALSNLPLIEISDVVVNGTRTRFRGAVNSGVELNLYGGHVAAPTRHGVVRAPMESAARSLSEHRLPEEAADWPEGWYAVEDREGFTAALLWGRATRVSHHGRWPSLRIDLPDIAPGQSAGPGPLFLYVGEGDHTTARRWWQQLFGPRADRPQHPPETRRPLEYGLQPRPLVLHGREAAAQLAVDSVGRLELSGSLRVDPPQGLRVEPRRIEFNRLSGRRRSYPVRITRGAKLPEGAYPVECVAQLDRAVYRERQPVIVLGDPAAKVTTAHAGDSGELFTVSNGLLSLTIAPGFSGCAVSLRRGEEELLRSSYPEPCPLAWENPWCGGICPTLDSLGSETHKEHFRAREIERRGRQGVLWRGVRLTCVPRQERGRDESLAFDYLLAPGSSILALAMRTKRRAGTPGRVSATFGLWPVLGGSHFDAVLSRADDNRTSRLRNEFGSRFSSPRWVVAENPTCGQAVAVAGNGPHVQTFARVVGEAGYSLGAGASALHEAGETRESVFFVTFGETTAARDLADALCLLEGLP